MLGFPYFVGPRFSSPATISSPAFLAPHLYRPKKVKIIVTHYQLRCDYVDRNMIVSYDIMLMLR